MIDEQVRRKVQNWMDAQRLHTLKFETMALVESWQLLKFENATKGHFFIFVEVDEETRRLADIVSNAWYALEQEERRQQTGISYPGIAALMYCFQLYSKGNLNKRTIPNSIWLLVEAELEYLALSEEPNID